MNNKNLNNNNSTTSTNKTINKRYNDNSKNNNTTYNRQLNKINNATKQQTQQNKNKNYLQDLLINYLDKQDNLDLQDLANTITSATLNNYSKNSNDGRYLKNQLAITKKLARVQRNYSINSDDEYLDALKQLLKQENQDIKDLVSEVKLSLYENSINIDNAKNNIDLIIKLAYNSINSYLWHQRTLKINDRPFTYSLEYLTENGINLVDVRGTIIAYTNYNEDLLDNLYNINNYYNYDTEKLTYQRKLIITLFNKFTKYQRQIIKYLSCGDSVRQIAKKLNRTSTPIQKQITIIRQIAKSVKSEFDKIYYNN